MFLDGSAARVFVSRIDVTGYADTRIVREHAVQSPCAVFRAIRHRHLPRVKRIPDADSAPVVN